MVAAGAALPSATPSAGTRPDDPPPVGGKGGDLPPPNNARFSRFRLILVSLKASVNQKYSRMSLTNSR